MRQSTQWSQGLRLTTTLARIVKPDVLIFLALSLGAFIVYLQTLVPSFLDGDPGHFQYIPSILGIPYPPGFPLYVLLGHAWSHVPIGTLAYRMNAFSAFFGALTISILFVALRRQNLRRLASLGGAITLAVIPSFWQYSTVAAEYTLHTFIIVICYVFLDEWRRARQSKWFFLLILGLGLGLSNHPTFLLLVPAILLYLVMADSKELRSQIHRNPQAIFLLLVPLALYFYFPLRGYMLLTHDWVLPDLESAVARGIVSPFFHNDPSGWLDYFTARTFVTNMIGEWQWQTAFAGTTQIIESSIGLPLIIIGALGFARLFWKHLVNAIWLMATFLTVTLVAMQYAFFTLSNTDYVLYFSKFFLPCFIVLAYFIAWGADYLLRLPTDLHLPQSVSMLALVLVIGILGISIWQSNGQRSESYLRRSVEIETKWRAVQKYPPEPDAAVVGHWGDLTPMWYLQSAEAWRSDLVALFPPTEDLVKQWLDTNKPLYLAGSLLEWAPGITQNYTLTAWGELVRVAARDYALEPMPSHRVSWVFADERPLIRMTGFDSFAPNIRVGETIDVAIYWEMLGTMSTDDYLVYVWLSSPSDDTAKQESNFVVNWFPSKSLRVGQRAMSIYRFNILPTTKPGKYDLRFLVYSLKYSNDLSISGNDEEHTSLSLGSVNVDSNHP